MQITGKITGLKYKSLLRSNLQKIDFKGFDINAVPSSCIVTDGVKLFGISKWVSPKRTRSYPFERVYNTLNISKKVTVIPLVKDEGAKGDRDFLQWDTVSLMSLLDVYVIFAYYNKADKAGTKITNQQFDNKFVIRKIKEIEEYHSSALHWNINELKNELGNTLKKVILSYSRIEKSTRIPLHDIKGLKKFQDKIEGDIIMFMEFSREKAMKAQSREVSTVQPKEHLKTLTKAKITITNYLGGAYYLTVDEIYVGKEGLLYLIEGKHSKNSLLPNISDIKDGLLKMLLYCNLIETKVDGNNTACNPVLELTSVRLKGQISSRSHPKSVAEFSVVNHLNKGQKSLIEQLFSEANINKFIVTIGNSKEVRL